MSVIASLELVLSVRFRAVLKSKSRVNVIAGIGETGCKAVVLHEGDPYGVDICSGSSSSIRSV